MDALGRKGICQEEMMERKGRGGKKEKHSRRGDF